MPFMPLSAQDPADTDVSAQKPSSQANHDSGPKAQVYVAEAQAPVQETNKPEGTNREHEGTKFCNKRRDFGGKHCYVAQKTTGKRAALL